MKAILQSQLGTIAVDRNTRIAAGLKLLENNRDVTFKGADGQPKGFRTSDGLIDGLLSHAGNRAIPAHLTHDWTSGEKDALNSRVGAFKNFRKDENGHLIGDYHAMPGVDGDRMLWLAEHDPEHAALSLVFDYNPIKTDSVTFAFPLSFDSADFVANGAAVSALLTQFKNDTDMTKEEIQALIDGSVKAALAAHKPEIPANLITSEAAAAMADEKVKAALAAYVPKISEEDMIAAEAKVVAKLGSGPLLQSLTRSNDNATAYQAKLAEYVRTSPNKGTAIRRMLSDHPELGQAHEESLQVEIARLSGQAA